MKNPINAIEKDSDKFVRSMKNPNNVVENNSDIFVRSISRKMCTSPKRAK